MMVRGEAVWLQKTSALLALLVSFGLLCISTYGQSVTGKWDAVLRVLDGGEGDRIFLDFRQMGTHVIGTVTTIGHVYVVADVSTCAEYMGSYGHEEHDEDV